MAHNVSERLQRKAAQKPPTITDVAKRAGVSVGTVSHVLSGARSVAPATRRRVDRAVKELGYRPSFTARSLTRGRTMTVGMVVPDIVNPIFSQLLEGAEDALADWGYAVLFGSSENDLEKERRYLESFRERQVDGMIVDVATGSDPAVLAALREEIPVVLVDRLTPGWAGDAVLSADEFGMGLAVDHLVQLGHARIALVNGEPDVSGAQRRRQGFTQRLARYGLESPWVSEGTFTMDSGRDQARAILSSDAEPTAICCGNDVLAMGVLAVMHEREIDVPGTISVTGYDDIEFAGVVTPALTTVTQPMRAMGTAAARLLKQRIDEPDEPANNVTLKGELIVRGSTSSAASG
jgi:LacI family transcriptional regulator